MLQAAMNTSDLKRLSTCGQQGSNATVFKLRQPRRLNPHHDSQTKVSLVGPKSSSVHALGQALQRLLDRVEAQDHTSEIKSIYRSLPISLPFRQSEYPLRLLSVNGQERRFSIPKSSSVNAQKRGQRDEALREGKKGKVHV